MSAARFRGSLSTAKVSFTMSARIRFNIFWFVLARSTQAFAGDACGQKDEKGGESRQYDSICPENEWDVTCQEDRLQGLDQIPRWK